METPQNHNQFIRCVENIQDLTAQKHKEYVIRLNSGIYSRKTIEYIKTKNKYKITNHIDNSKQILTEKELMNEKITHIGKAMKLRALIAIIN